MIRFHVFTYEMSSYKPRCRFWQTRFQTLPEQSTPHPAKNKISREIIPQVEHVAWGGIVPVSSANEMTPSRFSCWPTYPVGPWCTVILATVLASTRRWGAGLVQLPAAKRSQLTATATQRRTREEFRRTHWTRTRDWYPHRTHTCLRQLKSKAGKVLVVPVKSNNGLISLASSSENCPGRLLPAYLRPFNYRVGRK